ADISVVVVTYNSADDIPGLIDSLRTEAADLRLRVIIADNSSTDDTLARVRMHDDVTVVETGGNLGYAGGINVARAHLGAGEDLLILNPDLRVERGAIVQLKSRLDDDPRL